MRSTAWKTSHANSEPFRYSLPLTREGVARPLAFKETDVLNQWLEYFDEEDGIDFNYRVVAADGKWADLSASLTVKANGREVQLSVKDGRSETSGLSPLETSNGTKVPWDTAIRCALLDYVSRLAGTPEAGLEFTSGESRYRLDGGRLVKA